MWQAATVLVDGTVASLAGPEAAWPTASVGKLWLLAEIAGHVAEGRLDPRRPVGRPAPVQDSGLWQHLHADSLTVSDAAVLTASVSDNMATNALLEVVSFEDVDRRADALGAPRCRIHDLVRDERGPGHAPCLSTGVARELAEGARRIAAAASGREGLGVSPAAAVLLESWLLTGVDSSMVLDPLVLDPLAHAGTIDGTRAWSKTGADPGVRADVGVVSGVQATVAYAAIARWDPVRTPDGAAEARERMRSLGREVAERAGVQLPG